MCNKENSIFQNTVQNFTKHANYQRYPASSHRIRSTSLKFSQLGIAFAIAMHTMAATTSNCKISVWKFLSVIKYLENFYYHKKYFQKNWIKLKWKLAITSNILCKFIFLDVAKVNFFLELNSFESLGTNRYVFIRFANVRACIRAQWAYGQIMTQKIELPSFWINQIINM